MPVDDAVLFAAAERVMEQAYAPYSSFQVGAALLTVAGGLFVGCNVENISYPLATCAERNAIAAAMAAEGPEMRLLRLAVAARSQGRPQPCAPCGACRQVILEFGPDATVLFRDAGERLVHLSARELLPRAFSFELPSRT
jgi:cytidine deaminase